MLLEPFLLTAAERSEREALRCIRVSLSRPPINYSAKRGFNLEGVFLDGLWFLREKGQRLTQLLVVVVVV